MKRATFLLAGIALIALTTSALAVSNGMAPPANPQIIATSPQNGAQNVSPASTTISVTFDRPMMDKSWSWAYENKETFPEVNGDPAYDATFTINTLPVKLRPDTTYVIWINTEKLKSFKSKDGVAATPFKFTFSTGKGPGS